MANSFVFVPLLSPRLANDDFGLRDRREHIFRRRQANSLGRVFLRAEHDEVVVHHVEPLRGVSVLDKLVFLLTGVHKQHVCITLRADLDRLPRADRHYVDLGIGLLLENRQDVIQQARVVGAGGRRQAQRLRRLRRHSDRRGHLNDEQQNAKCGKPTGAFHIALHGVCGSDAGRTVSPDKTKKSCLIALQITPFRMGMERALRQPADPYRG